jgi:tetratricopeptide (TPR) repeat protein
MRFMTCTGLAALLLSLLLCSCSAPVTLGMGTSGSGPADRGHSTEPGTAGLADQVGRCLSQNDPEQAQALLAEVRSKEHARKSWQESAARVVNRLLDKADRARTAGRLQTAGELLRMAREIYPDAATQPAVNMTRAEIEAAIALCSEDLMKAGLAEYRAGDLDAAISAWEGIGRFQPGYAPARIAVETARRQRQQLENLTEKNRPNSDNP